MTPTPDAETAAPVKRPRTVRDIYADIETLSAEDLADEMVRLDRLARDARHAGDDGSHATLVACHRACRKELDRRADDRRADDRRADDETPEGDEPAQSDGGDSGDRAQGDTTPAAETIRALEAMSASELRGLCREYGLSSAGTKAEMTARLGDAIDDD